MASTRVARLLRPIAIVIVALLSLVGTPTLAAQASAQDSAYAVVTRLFDATRTRDTTTMRILFLSNASMQSLTADGVSVAPVDGWIASVGRARAGLVLDERLANPFVHVDGDLATIWVDYWFFAGDRFSHCGVDAFQLARRADGWRIFSVVDTRRTVDCAAPPPR